VTFKFALSVEKLRLNHDTCELAFHDTCMVYWTLRDVHF